MTKRLLLLTLILTLVAWVVGCDKETTTTSSEYREIIGQGADTVFLSDTVLIDNPNGTTVYDTTILHDTISFSDTVMVYDTVIQTVTQVDTVISQTNGPTVQAAFLAMQAYTDIVVIEDITATVGLTDGWVFYLSAYMSYVDSPGTGVYDLAGYIDFWAPDFSDFYAYEYGWRMTYISGDPGDPNNWQVGEIPGASPIGKPGLNRIEKNDIREALR
ncbi:MAG: hypothetical protein P1R58_02350 [bacterium]|nr:hypothetical protein [bacterium]